MFYAYNCGLARSFARAMLMTVRRSARVVLPSEYIDGAHPIARLKSFWHLTLGSRDVGEEKQNFGLFVSVCIEYVLQT